MMPVQNSGRREAGGAVNSFLDVEILAGDAAFAMHKIWNNDLSAEREYHIIAINLFLLTQHHVHSQRVRHKFFQLIHALIETIRDDERDDQWEKDEIESLKTIVRRTQAACADLEGIPEEQLEDPELFLPQIQSEPDRVTATPALLAERG